MNISICKPVEIMRVRSLKNIFQDALLCCLASVKISYFVIAIKDAFIWLTFAFPLKKSFFSCFGPLIFSPHLPQLNGI